MQAHPPLMQHSIVCIALRETTTGYKFTGGEGRYIRAGIFTRGHKKYSNFSSRGFITSMNYVPVFRVITRHIKIMLLYAR